MADYPCSIDNFAATLVSLIGDTFDECDERVAKAVEQSTRKGVKLVKQNAEKGGLHEWSDKYVGGFSSHIERGRNTTTGEIGNKGKPGLVHLLEKGHATLTGRRTRAYPHMAPAFEEMQEDFIERVDKAIGLALGG